MPNTLGMSSSGVVQRVVLTYDDYAAMPADGRRYELHEGEIYVNPAPTPRHQRISRDLEFLLHAHVVEGQLGEVFNAPIDVILGRVTVVQPDIVFVARERLAMVSERGIEGAPDLVVEILSPSTEVVDRGAKLQLYARHGVRHYWIVDPAACSLAEHVLADRDLALRGTFTAPDRCTTALFPDLVIPLADILGG